MMHSAKKTARKRTYLDPIHQDIILNPDRPEERLVMDLMDTPEFQRLRRINQLGVSYFTFQGAEGSRFTHSVGVMHIASRLVDLLAEKTPSIKRLKPLILATALLHDIGHGPYSHVTEQILHYNHEEWSCKIITGDTAVAQTLRRFSTYQGDLANDIRQVLEKEFRPAYVSHMVSSQLDCDRFDYLLRDSYMTGVAYGLFALQRILFSLELDLAGDRIVVAEEKGQTAVEDYLFARYSMYAQVYYHKKNIAARALLSKLIRRARQLGGKVSFMDEPTGLWLLGKPLEVKDYLKLDDVQMTYHIKRWVDDEDPILSDLASRFVDRRLLKAMRLPPGSQDTMNEIAEKARSAVSAVGLDPEYYTSVETSGIQPYDYYRPEADSPQTSIMVRTEAGEIRELSELSGAVDALVRGNFESGWLTYPAEAQQRIAQIADLARTRQ